MFCVTNALPWLVRLLVGLSPGGPGFCPRPLEVRLEVNKVAQCEVLLRARGISPDSTNSPALRIYLSLTDAVPP